MATVNLTDWTGQEVSPGDFVVYPTKAKGGLLHKMNIGKVVEFRDKTKKGEPYRIHGVDMGWNHNSNTNGIVQVPYVIVIKPYVNSHKKKYNKENIIIKSTRHIFKISNQEADRLIYLRENNSTIPMEEHVSKPRKPNKFRGLGYDSTADYNW